MNKELKRKIIEDCLSGDYGESVHDTGFSPPLLVNRYTGDALKIFPHYMVEYVSEGSYWQECYPERSVINICSYKSFIEGDNWIVLPPLEDEWQSKYDHKSK